MTCKRWWLTGAGGSIEWSLRFIRAKEVMGMWQEIHLFPALPSLMVRMGRGVLHPFLVAGHAGIVGLSSLLNR